MQHPSEQIVEAITRIYESGLTTTSGGNLSVRDADGTIWITPAAADKGALRGDDIVCVRPDGSKSGALKPSSELPFHRAIYVARPDLNALVHAHPCALVSFSIVRKTPDMNLTPQARRVCGTFGYAPYALPGSKGLGEAIACEFGAGHDCVLMENHGAVVGGRDLPEAMARFEMAEHSARSLVNAAIVGTPARLADEKIATFEARFQHGDARADHPASPDDDRALRKAIVGMVRRACRQGMMTSTFGTVSVRSRGNDFLVTPRDRLLPGIGTDDIVGVHSGRHERGKRPDRAVGIHQKIYELNPEVKAIVSACPPNLAAFAVARVKPDVRTIPESWLCLQDIPLAPFGSPYDDPGAFARRFESDRPGVLVENEGFIVTGSDLLQAYDRLEVAEFSARSLVRARALGNVVPIGDREVEELRRAFLD